MPDLNAVGGPVVPAGASAAIPAVAPAVAPAVVEVKPYTLPSGMESSVRGMLLAELQHAGYAPNTKDLDGMVRGVLALMQAEVEQALQSK